MNRKDLFAFVVSYFEENMPVAETELVYSNPFELLVSVILSAQCTDKRVNLVTPALFKAFPDAHLMSLSTVDELFPYIKSISYPNNKAKNLLAMAKMLHAVYHDVIPSEVDELVKLPGVGRKTANVIASVIYQLPAMAVDTHVFRVSARTGLTVNAKTPLAAEKQLMKYLPLEKVPKAHHWLILHGRYICLARKPKCELCGLTMVCKYYEKNHLKRIIAN